MFSFSATKTSGPRERKQSKLGPPEKPTSKNKTGISHYSSFSLWVSGILDHYGVSQQLAVIEKSPLPERRDTIFLSEKKKANAQCKLGSETTVYESTHDPVNAAVDKDRILQELVFPRSVEVDDLMKGIDKSWLILWVRVLCLMEIGHLNRIIALFSMTIKN